MQKMIVFLKHPLSFPVSILTVNYIYWLFTAPMSLFDDNFSNYIAGITLLGIYILSTGLAKIASASWKLTIGFIILGSYLLFLLTLYTVWFLSESIQWGGYTPMSIFAVEILLATSYPIIVLLSNKTIKNRITSLVLFITMLPILGASFVYPIHFHPEILNEAKLENYMYYIVSSVDWDNHSFQSFYRCNSLGFDCRELYFSYSGFVEIIVDEQNKEVSLLGFGGLVYTDGENPRSYDQPAFEFKDHIYQFSNICNNFNNDKGYYSCESYTYQLYECDINHKSCISLPVQYTAQDYGTLLIIEGNEENNEINIYDDWEDNINRTLISTYGKHPRCYVDGCEILEETK